MTNDNIIALIGESVVWLLCIIGLAAIGYLCAKGLDR